ncbi:hypothetical protein BDW72DRAFT_108559 [Aspergillus terricola var. indicus]
MRPSHRLPRMMPLQHARRFHQTRPAPFINEALDVASSFIHGVHSASHLPWALSIPLTAFLIRMGVALPLQIFTKVQARKESDLSPILMAWRQHYQRKAQNQTGSHGPILAREAKIMTTKNLKGQYDALRRRWGLVRWYRPANILQVPIWITVMESLRAMSGADKSLAQTLLALFSSGDSESQGSAALRLTVEPSFAAEGALWFPDLLASDSTGILPAVLTVTMLINIRNGWKVPTLRSAADLPLKEMGKQMSSTLFRLLVQCMALNVGLACYTQGMPVAVMIYWITSTNIATAQTFLLQKYMFPTPSLKPWKQIHIAYSKRGQKAASQN